MCRGEFTSWLSLKETGVGKTVNGLRKHELVGDFAKNLVARWKKLVPVPQEADRWVSPLGWLDGGALWGLCSGGYELLWNSL